MVRRRAHGHRRSGRQPGQDRREVEQRRSLERLEQLEAELAQDARRRAISRPRPGLLCPGGCGELVDDCSCPA